MRPGRELDALIAEKVMGLIQYGIMAEFGRPGTISAWCLPEHKDTLGALRALRPYSTDISAAWEVVAIFKERGLRIDYDTEYGCDRKQGWSVTIGGKVLSQFEPTVELAICLAALAACGHPV